MNDLFEGALMNQNSTKINNQIEILKSSFTINQTMQNLNWHTSWYKKNFLLWNGIYKHEPFDVQETQGFVNPSGVKVYITPVSDNSYAISVDGQYRLGSTLADIIFKSQGEFGKPFENEYFNFTLLKKVANSNSVEGEFYFVFNDRKQTTLSYQIGRAHV